MQGECLWRIKDAEELIKARITTASVDSKIKDLTVKVQWTIDDHKNEIDKRLVNELSVIPGKIDTIRDYSEQKYNDAKLMVVAFEKQLIKLASRE